MRIFLSSVFIVTTLVFTYSVSAAEPPELSPEKLTDIKTSCIGVQVVLQKIQYNDAATRVNRGQGYESMVTHMIIPMNSRVALGGLSSSAATLTGITTRYQQSLSNFKNNYEDYDDALGDSLRVKCKDKPAEFYNHLSVARKYRADLSNDVAQLAQLTEEYRQAVIKLKGEL